MVLVLIGVLQSKQQTSAQAQKTLVDGHITERSPVPTRTGLHPRIRNYENCIRSHDVSSLLSKLILVLPIVAALAVNNETDLWFLSVNFFSPFLVEEGRRELESCSVLSEERKWQRW